MEDLWENIGILLLIVVGVIAKIGESSLNGRKKKGSTTSIPEEAETDAPKGFEEIFKEITIPEQESAEMPTASQYSPTADKAVKPAPCDFVTDTTGIPADYSTADKLQKKHEHPSKMHENTSKQQTHEEQEEFDLRKAVIYSEILAPKFKDYD